MKLQVFANTQHNLLPNLLATFRPSFLAMAPKRKMSFARGVALKARGLPQMEVEEHIAALRDFVRDHKKRRKPAPMPKGKLRVFADCVGIGSEMIALALLGFEDKHMEFVGGTEKDPMKRSLLQAVHKALNLSTQKERLQHDIFDRRLEDTIPSDLYIAGFPCPAYSSCGKKLGARDGLRRGLLLFEGLKYIAYWKPRVVILEQVQGFLDKKHAKTHKAMRKFFAALSYIVYMKKLSTKEHGVPQSRCRCYFVAFLQTAKKQQFHFRFPKSIACPTLKSFLDTDRLGSEKAPLPFYEEKHGPNIWKEDTVLDIGASAKWQSKMNNLCPCLIRTRCLQKGYYLPKQLRRLDGVECARFQGIPAAIFEKMMAAVQRKTSFSTPEAAEKQVMGALGDSMSINVLMRLLPAALQAGSLWPSNLERQDPWKQCRTADLADLSDRLFEAASRGGRRRS